MPPLTTLTEAEIAEAAARFALGEVVSCQPLWSGTINSNFRIQTANRRFFLRVNEGKTLDDVAYEAELVDHLAGRGVPTPRPVAAVDGRRFADLRGKLLTLFPWASGAHVDPPLPEHARAVGAALAQLHLAGESFALRRESRYAPRLMVERARELAARPDLSAEISGVLREALDGLAALPSSPRGVIHGDLFPDNVLFAAGGPLLLDFEQASDGHLVYDLAVLLLSWCWDGSDFRSELTGAMRAGYEAVRRLPPEDWQALHAACAFAALRFTVTRLSDVELRPGASPELKQLKDFRDFFRRWRRLQVLGAQGLKSML